MPSRKTSPKRPVYRIASIPGDGIGPEVIDAAIEVLKSLTWILGDFELHFDQFEWGSKFYKLNGNYLPENGIEALKKYDAILFGSVGAPDVPDHISLWGLRLAICNSLQQYVNVRPIRLLRGVTSPLRNCEASELDWLIIRENSESEYAGHGGRSHIGQPWEVATEVAVFTRHGVERLMRFAFMTAGRRSRKKLTVVTKSNAQRHGLVLWDEIALAVAKDFPAVDHDITQVDAMTARMVLHPSTIDTIVATGLHADILSALAATLAGSIGNPPASNLDPSRAHPSMFEPMHGSAPALAGHGTANPIGAFCTAAEMLKWLGHPEAAESLLSCVERVCAEGIRTPDLGGKATTKDVPAAVCREVERELGFRLAPLPQLRRRSEAVKWRRRSLGFDSESGGSFF